MYVSQQLLPAWYASSLLFTWLCCVVCLQAAYQAQMMFGEALMSAVNVGQILHALDNAEDADKFKSRVRITH